MKAKASKNRKKGWRKVDISEVEDFLEDQNLQERTGGLVAEKTDDQLFFIDTPVEVKDKTDATADTKGTLRRSKREKKPLRCFEILEGDPRIPPITKYLPGHSKQNHIKATRPATQKLVSSLQHRKKALETRSQQRTKQKQLHQQTYDLWASEETNKLDEHFAVVTKRKLVKVPKKFYNKPSGLSAVEMPHPGSSYNPTFEDHQTLLQKSVTKQVTDDVKEAKLERRMKPDYKTAGGAPTQKSNLAEMSQGLGINEDSESENSDSNEDGDDFRLSVNPPTTRDKMKTKRQRRMRKERLKEAEMKIKNREERMREDRNMTKQLKSIKKQVELREAELAGREMKRQKQREESIYKTRRLNKQRYEELEDDVLLSSELSGSLRTTKSANTLIEDRFKSLQKRNIIEPRVRAKFRRKLKTKHPEKKPFKEITKKSRAGGGIVVPFVPSKHGQTE